MKIKYLFAGLVVSTVMLSSCTQVDEINRLEGIGTAQLSVKGFIVGNTDEYPAIIDPEAGTITVQVPYYISDTDPIMGDLTQMKLEATTPVGYSFNPSISGIHDLAAGYRTNLLDDKGHATSYTILAEYVKSSSTDIASVVLTEMERATIIIKAPAAEGEHGTVSIYKTSSAIDGALHSAIINVAPWATFECSAYDPETGIADLSDYPQITVTAQDGVTKAVYDIVVDYPAIKDYGAGYTAALFGFQPLTSDPRGFEVGANTTMAVVGDYLILSNRLDVSKMPVYDRFTGKYLEDVKVNVTGLPTDRSFAAICTDDAGHLIAATYVNSNVNYNGGVITDPNVRIFAWVNGIENAPKPILWADMNGSYFQGAPRGVNGQNNYDMFNTISCKGDITSGNAAIGTISRAHPRCVILPFVNGTYSKAYVEWAGNGAGAASMWCSTKCRMLTSEAPWSYVWDQGMARMGIFYIPAGTANNRCVFFEQPESHWWVSPAPLTPNWSYVTRSNDVIEFNGTQLLATTNGYSSNGNWTYRLYVADITMSPNSKSLGTGLVFDSRDGNAKGNEGVPGTGVTVTGMSSGYSFTTGTVLGKNATEMNDVIFARSEDGTAVQVYMLVSDQALIAYEITCFDI